MESVWDGENTFDWISGNKFGDVARDLENPLFNCFTDVELEGEGHLRSIPLGHWFYLISQGDSNADIPALGIETAMRIVISSLSSIGKKGDYEDMRNAVLSVVDDEYGICSDESRAVRFAWDQICVGPSINHYPCDFHIEGLPSVCEENNFLNLYIDNVTPRAFYRWHFPIEWTVQGAVGNSYEGADLIVTGFPAYEWYPRYFPVAATAHTYEGPNYTHNKIVKLIDCDGDDPTCEKFYSIENRGIVYNTANEVNNSIITKIKVFNLLGNLLYSGIPSNFDLYSLPYSGILILSYFDKSGGFIKSDKVVLIK